MAYTVQGALDAYMHSLTPESREAHWESYRKSEGMYDHIIADPNRHITVEEYYAMLDEQLVEDRNVRSNAQAQLPSPPSSPFVKPVDFHDASDHTDADSSEQALITPDLSPMSSQETKILPSPPVSRSKRVQPAQCFFGIRASGRLGGSSTSNTRVTRASSRRTGAIFWELDSKSRAGIQKRTKPASRHEPRRSKRDSRFRKLQDVLELT